MALPVTLIDLAGSVALLLWGVHMVQTGVQRAFGARLRAYLGSALRNRFTAFLAGLGVTTILQSSTATGLMITGFAAGGLVDLVPALAVMLGANVGTTLIVQVLSFNVAEIAPALILLGVLTFRRSSAAPRDFGRVLIGLGLILMALREFVMLLEPYEDVPSLRLLLGAIATEPVLDVMLGAGVTWAAHSSVAVVLLVISFAAKGVIPPDAAFALVLGANLGTAINPVLEGGAGHDPASRRLPLGNLINRVVGAVIVLAVLPRVGAWFVTIESDNARAVADFHTAFNLILAAIFFPFLKPYAALLRRILPARVDPADPSKPLYLDDAALGMPFIALGGAAREALRLSDVLEAMLAGLRDALEKLDRRQVSAARRLDDVLDKLNMAIKAYLTAIDPEALTEADHRRLSEIFAFTTNMEQAGDVVDKDLLGIVSKQRKRGVVFAPEDQAQLLAVIDRLIANVRASAAVFMTDDHRAGKVLTDEQEAFRRMEAEATSAHIARLRSNPGDLGEASALHLDALRHCRRLNSLLLAASAHALPDANGDVFPDRLQLDG